MNNLIAQLKAHGMAEIDADTQGWHKRFAMNSNNLAWALSVQPRTPAQDREMLDAAHASAFHWGQIGTELHRMRATTLLAEVHALLGDGKLALSLAKSMRDYFLTARETPDWEIALVHAIHAHAAWVAGQSDLHRSAYAEAVTAIAAIAAEEDRRIVVATFMHVPPP